MTRATTHHAGRSIAVRSRSARQVLRLLALAGAFSLGLASNALPVGAKGLKKQPAAQQTQPAVQQAKPQRDVPKQPHMQRALLELELAKSDLSQASRGKGGWVQLAQQHVSAAISSVRQGIQYGQGH